MNYFEKVYHFMQYGDGTSHENCSLCDYSFRDKYGLDRCNFMQEMLDIPIVEIDVLGKCLKFRNGERD